MSFTELNVKKGLLLVSIILMTHIENNASAAFNNKQVVAKSSSSITAGAPLPLSHKPKIRTKKRWLTIYITRHVIAAQMARYKKGSAGKKKNTAGKIIILVVLFLLAAILVFLVAYGGGSAGVLILVGAIAIGLLVWLGISMFKPKRKKAIRG
jgi:Flp pilus assembly protein TadB